MRIEQVKDILEHTRRFHELISDYYQDLSKHTDKERLRIILDYLAEHERHLENALAEYEKCAAKEILNVWLPYSPCQKHLVEFRLKLEAYDISPKEIAEKIIALDDCVINMYKELLSQTDSSEVKDVLHSILDFEEQEKRIAVRDLVWMEDV